VDCGRGVVSGLSEEICGRGLMSLTRESWLAFAIDDCNLDGCIDSGGELGTWSE